MATKRRTELPCLTRNILIYTEDWDFLAQRFGAGSLHPIGVGPIIREIVHRKIKELREREQQAVNTSPNTPPTQPSMYDPYVERNL